MIAIAQPSCHLTVEALHQRFISMLPKITQLAQRPFRQYVREARDELVQEVIANAFVAYARLAELGKQAVAFPTPLAGYAIRQVRCGRRVGSRSNRRDILQSSRHTRVSFEALVEFGHPQRLWSQSLIEDKSAGPAETAAARIDLRAWFYSLSPRDRRVAMALAMGATTSEVAATIGVTAGRISQRRHELERSWCRLHNRSRARASDRVPV